MCLASAVVLVALLVTSCAYALTWRAGAAPARHRPDKLQRTAAVTKPAKRTASRPAAKPNARRAGDANEEACYAALSDAGVAFTRVQKSSAPGVDWPINLTSAIGGIAIRGGKKNAPTNYLDCRLAQALLGWAPSLRAQGVVALEHLSAYRRQAVVAGTNKQSGHALGWAIDVARFELRDGRKLSVLNDWTNRARGADPCQQRATDSEAAEIMRTLVCGAAEQQLFRMVLTPHYNDAHKNHVHLEIGRKGEGSWIA
ncbi:MAG TPA: extensin family protein [Polyangiales bacterium]|nr:extensin family protein [Polyangiales bacterium]